MQEKTTQLEVKKKESKKLPSKEMKLFCQDPITQSKSENRKIPWKEAFYKEQHFAHQNTTKKTPKTSQAGL